MLTDNNIKWQQLIDTFWTVELASGGIIEQWTNQNYLFR